MATLTINGKSVQVDDSFLKLSPADQEKTVEEIAAKVGAAASTAPQPGSPAYAAQFMARQVAGQPQPQPAQQPPGLNIPDVMPAWARAASTHAVEGLPVIGGILRQTNSSPMFDQINKQADQQAPLAATAGDVFGTVAPFAAGGEIPAVAKALGMSSDIPGFAGLLTRTGVSAASNAAISGADTLTRGGTLQDALHSAEFGGAAGALMPGMSDLIGKTAGAVGRKIGQFTNPNVAAQRMVSGAAAADVAGGARMTPIDEANAVLNGQPIVNADRFGGNVRTLARTAKNSDPASGAALDELTQDRFGTQNVRAVQFVKRITGGATDDLALQDQIQNAARASNKGAYDKAYAAPGAQSVWTPEIKQLFQSPDFLKAVQGATKTGANDAAISGFPAIKNPFQFNPDGSISLQRLPGGGVARPNLQFWDIVQRNLRTNSEEAYRNGKNLLGSQLAQMRGQLLKGLDGAVPDFAKARAGAAAAFGAEDALEAGRNFVTQRTAIPEAQRAYMQFKPAERKAFGVGFASSLIDKIGATSDRVNVINQVFGSPASRSQVELALGKPAAAQLEQFVRVEDIMQMTKQAVQGNSTTAKQLIAAGVVGGGLGGALGGWDPRNIALGSTMLMAGRVGARALGKAVDQKIMQRVAQILSSGDQNEINKQILNATLSRQHALAVQAIERGLQIAGDAGTLAGTRASNANDQGGLNDIPRITVRGSTP